MGQRSQTVRHESTNHNSGQGIPGFVHARYRLKFKDFSRTFKAMYQQIQGLNTEEKVSVKSDVQLFKTQH